MLSCALTFQCFASDLSAWGGSPHEFLTQITCFLDCRCISDTFYLLCLLAVQSSGTVQEVCGPMKEQVSGGRGLLINVFIIETGLRTLECRKTRLCTFVRS